MIIHDSSNNINEYYIRELDVSNTANWSKKYFDVTYIASEISYNDSKMFLKLHMNIISNSNLPLGVFLIDLSMPGMELNNIPIFNTYIRPNTDIAYYPKWLCHVYTAKVEIDLTDNEYFHREIINENVKINVRFNIDIETFNNNKIIYDNESLSKLFYELKEQNMELNFSYSNTLIVNQSKTYDIGIGNWFDSNGQQKIMYEKLAFLLPEKLNNNILDNWFTLKTNASYAFINGYVTKFNYSNSDVSSSMDIMQKESSLINEIYSANLKFGYIYDFLNKKFINDMNMIGIYFPIEFQINYQMLFNINVSGKPFRVALTNNLIVNDHHNIISQIEDNDWKDYEKI
ncbi:MAG: hypothetical protein ACRCVI_00215 [Mycoplasmoidaceae bacterium]